MVIQPVSCAEKLPDGGLDDQDRRVGLAQQLPGNILEQDIHPAVPTVLVVPTDDKQFITSYLDFRQHLIYDQAVAQARVDWDGNAHLPEDLHAMLQLPP